MKINYKDFMDEVKLHIDKMSEKEMFDLILELARLTRKPKRVDFLNKFKKINSKDRKEEIKTANKLLEDIRNEEIHFNCSGYEVYGHNYWDSHWENEYSDPKEIGKKLEEVFLLAENLIYEKFFLEAAELYEQLLYLPYMAYDEISWETIELDLEEMIDEKLVNIHAMNCCNHMLYAMSQAKSGEERVESIYSMFQNTLFREIALEGMLSVGPVPFEDVDDFMYEFSEFLKNRPGDLESRLLRETMNFIKVDSLEFARNNSKIHPGIYYKLCKEAINMNNDEEVIRIGSDAMEYIPKEMVIRSKIALLTANSCKKLNNLKLYRKCLLEGFISDSTPYNFLKLFASCSKEEINEAYKFSRNISIQENASYPYKRSETAHNLMSKFEQDIIRFLYGDLDYAQRKSMEDKKYLGWTSSFKGICIPIFMVLLEKGQKDSKARNKVMEFINRRIGKVTNNTDDIKFDTLIQKWKEKIPLHGKEDFYLNWIKSGLD
ncbi:MAG: hypothetical protein GX947_05850, partial [Tissierellia bacterium]|nr:hypothetical protein [Tissierellia bacterium]